MKKYFLYIFFLIFAVKSFSQNLPHYLPLGSPVANSQVGVEILKQALIPSFPDTATANSMFGGSTGRVDLIGSIMTVRTPSNVIFYFRDTVSTGGHKWTTSSYSPVDPTFQQTLDVPNGNILLHNNAINAGGYNFNIYNANIAKISSASGSTAGVNAGTGYAYFAAPVGINFRSPRIARSGDSTNRFLAVNDSGDVYTAYASGGGTVPIPLNDIAVGTGSSVTGTSDFMFTAGATSAELYAQTTDGNNTFDLGLDPTNGYFDVNFANGADIHFSGNSTGSPSGINLLTLIPASGNISGFGFKSMGHNFNLLPSTSLSGNYNFSFPSAAATSNGQILSGNTDGTTAWISPSGGGGNIMQQNTTATGSYTQSLGNNSQTWVSSNYTDGLFGIVDNGYSYLGDIHDDVNGYYIGVNDNLNAIKISGGNSQISIASGTMSIYAGGTLLSIADSGTASVLNINVPFSTNTPYSTLYKRSDGSVFWGNPTSGGGGSGLTSVGLSMPSAFTVSNSPLTSNGTIAVTGAGTTSQYIRGDGSLATLPSSGSALPNIGSGYRELLPNVGYKTFFANAPLILDSASNSNALTISADTATALTGLATQYDVNKFWYDNTGTTTSLTGKVFVSNYLTTGNILQAPTVEATSTLYVGTGSVLYETGLVSEATGAGHFWGNTTPTLTAQGAGMGVDSGGILGTTGDVFLSSHGNSNPVYRQVIVFSSNSDVAINGGSNADNSGYPFTAWKKTQFKDTVNLANIPTGTIVSGGNLGLDASNNIVKNTVSGGGSGGASNSNIGSGYRLAIPNTNNVKTLFFNAPLTADSTTNTNALTIKVDTTTTNTGLTTLYQHSLKLNTSVYEGTITKYGVPADAKMITDGVVTASNTTITSATANFTSADVGKTVGIPYAGTAVSTTSGQTFITTIASVTNSTTAVLSAAPVISVVGARTITDAAINNGTFALNSATANFTQGDIGKYISIPGAGLTVSSGGNPQACWITAIVSSTQATVSRKALATVSAQTVTIPGATVIYGTDATTAFQNAINTSVANKKVLLVEAGNYLISSSLAPLSGLFMQGQGFGKSIIYPVGTGGFAAIQYLGSASTQLSNMSFRDFEINGIGNTTNTYASTAKAFYIRPSIGTLIDHVYVHDCSATGIGNDWMQNYQIINCLVIHNGRQVKEFGGGGGGSGIGIGTGLFDNEAGTVGNNTVIDCGNNGIFAESQSSTVLSKGIKYIGNYVAWSGNDGLGDHANDGLIMQGNTSEWNGAGARATLGFVAGTYSTNGLIADNVFKNNGVNVDVNIKNGTYYVDNNVTDSGSGRSMTATVITGGAAQLISFTNNKIYRPALNGIQFLTGGLIQSYIASDNIIYNAGNSTSTLRAAITTAMTATSGVYIKNNKAIDNNATGSKKMSYGFEQTAGTIATLHESGNDFGTMATGSDIYSGTITSKNINWQDSTITNTSNAYKLAVIENTSKNSEVVSAVAGNGISITPSGGNLTISSSASAASQTTVSGSTSGSAIFSEPFTGASYKKVIVYCNALVGSATYTYPVAFANTPAVWSTDQVSSTVVTTKTTTSITVTGATTSGFLIVEGF